MAVVAEAPSAKSDPTAPETVSADDKFLFDLQGYLMLRGVLAPEQVATLRETIYRLEARQYTDPWKAKYTKWGKPSGTCDRWTGQHRLNGILRLDPVFDQLIDQPTVLKYLRCFMDDPQLVNTWTISKTDGAEAGAWHRGTPSSGYQCHNGVIRTTMLNVVFFLTRNGPEDGCMAVLPGSHKSAIDPEFHRLDPTKAPGLQLVTGEPGDVLLFSESLYHNGMPKTSSATRTNIYFNNTGKGFNVMTYSPEHNRHFCMPGYVRERFNEVQKQRTRWMEFATADEDPVA